MEEPDSFFSLRDYILKLPSVDSCRRPYSVGGRRGERRTITTRKR